MSVPHAPNSPTGAHSAPHINRITSGTIYSEASDHEAVTLPAKTPYHHTAHFATKHKRLYNNASIFYRLHQGFFAMDIYGYSPSLMAAQFKTVVSLSASLLVYGAFLTAVAYTTYNWAVTPPTQSESTYLHTQSYVMLPKALSGGYAASQLGLPSFGIVFLLGDGTYVDFSKTTQFKLNFKQNTICNGLNSQKQSADIPYSPCNIEAVSSPIVGTLNTFSNCAMWDQATQVIQATSSYNPTCVPAADGQKMAVPRVVGTFTNTEYSYITASVSVNNAMLKDQAFMDNVYQSGIQVFILYNYTASSDLSSGRTDTLTNVSWSTRITPAPYYTVKSEVAMTARRVKICNFYWNLKSLADWVIDSKPGTVSSYVAANSTSNGFTDLGKVYLRFDDTDFHVEYQPPGDLIALLSGWGGLLALLLKLGMPAAIINKYLFEKKVKSLLKEDHIVFDENVRQRRQDALNSMMQGRREENENGHAHAVAEGVEPAGAPAQRAQAGSGSVDEHEQEVNGGAGNGHGGELVNGEDRATGAHEEGDKLRESAGGSGMRKRAGRGGSRAAGRKFRDSASASISVNYLGDIFADEDKEENFIDVMRHTTSECNALFHLRQVVKLVEERSPTLTIWGDQLARAATEDPSLAKAAAEHKCEGLASVSVRK